MVEFNTTDRIRIKDIAEKAGVSVGTVDRVLHNRPNVSTKARVKVEAVLNEINYQPNLYASALASNKKYKFGVMLPQHGTDAYWVEVEKGISRSVQNRNEFSLNMKLYFYDQFDTLSFLDSGAQMLQDEVDGAIIVPQQHDVTMDMCQQMKDKNIPYIFLDSNYPDIDALSFFGQEPIKSGYFAARIFMLDAQRAGEIMLLKQSYNGRLASKQQQYREVGFRQYMMDFYPDVAIRELNLVLNDDNYYDEDIDAFFEQYPNIKYGITFCSRAYFLGEYLLQNNHRGFHLLGYDMLSRNLECLKQGSIDFLIAQHPFQQGYASVEALFNHLVMKQQIRRDNYMPIELITAENYNYYKNENY